MEAGQNGTGRKGTEQRGMVEGRDATERNGKEGTTQNGTGQRNHFSSPWCTHRVRGVNLPSQRLCGRLEGAPAPWRGKRNGRGAAAAVRRARMVRDWFHRASCVETCLELFFKIAPTQVEAICKGLRIHFHIRDLRRIAGVTNLALGFQNVSSPTWPCFLPTCEVASVVCYRPRPIDNILVVAVSEPTERPEDANCGVWAETSRFLRVGWSAVFAVWTHLAEAHICAISQLGRHGAQ